METIIDVWEGSLNIDEPLLRRKGVVGIIIRLNSITGGLHMDENFTVQWEQAAGFLRAPYFVYNPWVSGVANFNWMRDHLPTSGVSVVFPDIEVKKPDYPPATYASEVSSFYGLSSGQYHTVIYTGGWFLPFLSYWPRCEYWWARYPYALCPPGDRQYWTWEEWYQKSNAYGFKPDPTVQCPGEVRVWQCSGDKLILPGTAERAIDLSLVNKTLPELEQWWGATLPPDPVDQVDILWREAGLHGWNLNP